MEAIEELDPEMAFLAKKEAPGNEWEIFKENVRPLKRGRNICLLNGALKSYTDSHLKKSLIENRRKLIQAIDEYKGDDPLQPWLECIKWVQEAFPPGGDFSGLVVIYEQCVRTFWHEDRYKDDLRYLKVWLEYAGNCVDAEIIYSFLDANNIGQTHSSFYIAYALHMEFKNKIKTANDIFNRGMSRDAQPIENLKAAYKKFFARSMRRPEVRDDDATENSLPVRSFGTVLARGETRNRTLESVDFTRKKSKQDRAHGMPLSIYADTKSDVSLGHPSESSSRSDLRPWHNLSARAERNKENNAIRSNWTSNKIPQRSVIGAATPIAPIEVFVDEKCADEHKESNERGEPSALQLRHGDGRDIKKETELLRQNPLRNFPLSCLPR